jgi:hypothetical protein
MAKDWTVKQIEAIRCPEGKDRHYVSLPNARGLNVMTTTKGARSYVWRGRHPVSGKQVMAKLGEVGTIAVVDVVERARLFNVAHGEGKYLVEVEAAEKMARAATMAAVEADATKTLQWVWDDLYVPRFKSDAETVRLMTKHVLPALGGKPSLVW